MDDSKIEDLLDKARKLFDQPGENFEEGLEVEDSTMLQLAVSPQSPAKPPGNGSVPIASSLTSWACAHPMPLDDQ